MVKTKMVKTKMVKKIKEEQVNCFSFIKQSLFQCRNRQQQASSCDDADEFFAVVQNRDDTDVFVNDQTDDFFRRR